MIEKYEIKARNIARSVIDAIEPQYVDSVVDSILGDIYMGASSGLEHLLENIDDSMGYYDIMHAIVNFKSDIDLKIMQSRI